MLVPRKLTAEMEDAADMRDDDEPLTDWGKMKPASRQAIWDAQIAAAPPPPAEQASGELPQTEYPDNPWREFIENCIDGKNYFRASEYRTLLADLDRGLHAIDRIAALSQRPVVPERIILWSRGVSPHWYFVAAKSSRPNISDLPVYETLDEIVRRGSPESLAPQQPEKGETP